MSTHRTSKNTTGTLRGEKFGIPKGIPVTDCDDGSGQGFVDRYQHLVPKYLEHEAEHYGIRVPLSDCEEIS